MRIRKIVSMLLVMLMVVSYTPLQGVAYAKEQATLTFGETGIEETVSGTGYTITGLAVVITDSGTYRITGSANGGQIEVAKGVSDVTLILDNLQISNADTAPIIIKKNANVFMKLEGESTLKNNEDPERETTDPDHFEGAVIKVKSASSLSIFGDGSLNVNGTAKNGIKGGADSALTVGGGCVVVNATNNGIAFDGSIVVNGGNLDITAGNDGLKSEPDEGDTESAGAITINGGAFNINAQGDGIQAAERLNINNGTFDIKTFEGYKSTSFNKDTMSGKGIKVSGNNNNETEPTNELMIHGGVFNLNTADDAIHSDGYCDITGGTFEIYTGDDGVHADATLTLGTENGRERDPEINVRSSYEGLEGITINIYSGKYNVVASDDGVNAAGGSSGGSDSGQQDSFSPGGQRPGQGGGAPSGQTNSGNYSLNIYGGAMYVDCQGDGLDSNGALNLLGGDITVLSMRGGGDNSPLDADGTITIDGAVVFAAGSKGMGVKLSNTSQSAYTSSNSYSANAVVNVVGSGDILRSEKLVRNINYLLYSAPNMGSCSVASVAQVDSCKSNAFAHNWDEGSVETAATTSAEGLLKYVCQSCGAIEYKTLAKLASVANYVEEDASSEPTEDVVYTASFDVDEHAKIMLYYSQNYGLVSEENVTLALARNGDTGLVDGTGDGQINFRVVTDDGYKIERVKVEGTYKNLKQLSETENMSNLYRITKVGSDLTVTVTTVEESAEGSGEGPGEGPGPGKGSFPPGDAPVIPCNHDYGSDWCKDTVQHWKECRCGDRIEMANHTYDSGIVTREATEQTEGIRTYTCTVCGQTKTESIAKITKTVSANDSNASSLEKDDVVKGDVDATTVRILDADKKEVSYVKPADSTQPTVNIGSTIQINTVTYKIVKIEEEAFQNNMVVTRVTIPNTVRTIGKNAFKGCKKLKKVSLSKNTTEIAANAFKGCASLTKITIPEKVTKIGTNAFYGCKKLKKIIVKTTKLKSTKVGKNAFKGTPKKATMKVPKKQLKTYKKVMKKKGFMGKVKA